MRNEPYFCHGIDVAYSTYVTAQLRQKLLAIEVPNAGEFIEDEWEHNIFRVYGTENNSVTAREIIAL